MINPEFLRTHHEQHLGQNPNRLYEIRLHTLSALDRYIEDHHLEENVRTLRDYQITVFEVLGRFLEAGVSEGYIKLPTGSGKTVLFTELAEATGLRTLVVMPTQFLVDQTGVRFQEFAEDLDVGKIYSDKKEYDKQVTLTTYDSFKRRVLTGEIVPEDYDLLILDEAHKALSDQRQQIVKLFDHAIKLGFTATPKYAETKELKDLLHNELHFMGIKEAVELGVLSPFSVYLAQTDIDLSNIRVSKHGDYDDEDLERAINIEARNIAAVDVYQRLFGEQKTIVYCVTRKHAEALSKLFNERGIPADFVSGAQSRRQQEERLKRYRDGEVRVLCNANLLIEGLDEPSANVCFNLRPTMSPVVAEQRAGRVLRLDPNNPDKHAIIVDFLGKDYTAGTSPGRNIPISFAQIVEGAHIFRKTLTLYEEGTEKGTKLYPEIDISGIKVIANAEEVMRVVREVSGVTAEGWYGIAALSRRFRLGDSNIIKVLEPFREIYSEYFKTITVGGQLKEYISPEMVTVIQHYLNPEEFRKGIQDTDFPIAYGAGMLLTKTFVGEPNRLRPLANAVAKKLLLEDRNLLAIRTIRGNPFVVVTDKARFIDEMKKLGARLIEPDMLEVQSNDFPITYGMLIRTFIGEHRTLKPLAETVINKLLLEDSNLIKRRRGTTHIVEVLTDRIRFIEEMKRLGAKTRDKNIRDVQDTDFVLSWRIFRQTFIGQHSELRPLINQCISLLKSEEPALLEMRKVGSQQFLVATSKESVIERMTRLGAKLREQTEIKEVQPGDFSLTAPELTRTFIGNHRYTRRTSLEVLDYLKSVAPDLIIQRMSGKRIVTAISDRERFISEMLSRGSKLKE